MKKQKELTRILFETKNEIATVTLNRAEINNAFDPVMIGEITETFKKIQKDKTLRAVVLTGAGKSFCAGADLNWMKSMAKYTYAQNLKDSQKLYEMFASIRDCDIPVIGKINGAAMGGGLGLIAVCDVVYAVQTAIFGFTEVKLGLSPAVISAFVKDKMRKSDMHRLFLSGEAFTAEEAKNSGLVHFLAADKTQLDQFVEASFKLNVYRPAPQAVRETKKLLRNLQNLKTETQLKSTTTKLIAKLRVSDEGQEGIASFLESRKPGWIKE